MRAREHFLEISACHMAGTSMYIHMYICNMYSSFHPLWHLSGRLARSEAQEELRQGVCSA